MQTITLQGLITLTTPDDYYFVVPQTPQGTALRNGLDNQVLEEVFIVIEGVGFEEFNLYLPLISTFNLAWNTKIYVSNTITSNDVNVYPQSLGDETNLINNNPSITFSIVKFRAYFHIISNTSYGQW